MEKATTEQLSNFRYLHIRSSEAVLQGPRSLSNTVNSTCYGSKSPNSAGRKEGFILGGVRYKFGHGSVLVMVATTGLALLFSFKSRRLFLSLSEPTQCQ